MGKRKSLRKEVVKITAEGEKSRVHFTLDNKGRTVTVEQKYEPNPDLIKFGQISVRGSTLKIYAFRNNPELVFIRIDNCWIPLNKFKWRELIGIILRGSQFHRLMQRGGKTSVGNALEGQGKGRNK